MSAGAEIPAATLAEIEAYAKAYAREAAQELLFDTLYDQAVHHGRLPETERSGWRKAFVRHPDVVKDLLRVPRWWAA